VPNIHNICFKSNLNPLEHREHVANDSSADEMHSFVIRLIECQVLRAPGPTMVRQSPISTGDLTSNGQFYIDLLFPDRLTIRNL
jgi:hypothetical protein